MNRAIFKKCFSYVPYKYNVAREDDDTETNEQIEKTSGVSSTTQKAPSFEELKLGENTSRETCEKMFKGVENLLNVKDGFQLPLPADCKP